MENKTEKPELTPKEIRQIRRYSTWPRLNIAAILGAVLVVGAWLIMTVIDQAILGAKLNDYTMFIMIAMVGLGFLNMGIYCCVVLGPICGARGKKWQNILQKTQIHQEQVGYTGQVAAGISMNLLGRQMSKSENSTASALGTAAQVAGAVTTASAVNKQLKTYAENAQNVAKEWSIPIPSVKLRKRLLVWLPSLLVILMFIPEIVSTTKANDLRDELVKQTGDQLEMVFDGPEYDNLNNTDGSAFQDFSSYLKDDPLDRYVNIKIGDDGTITKLSWYSNEDPTLSREENMANLVDYVNTTGELLRSSDLKFWTESFETGSILEEKLGNAYVEGAKDEKYNATLKEGETEYGFIYFLNSSSGKNRLSFDVERMQ